MKLLLIAYSFPPFQDAQSLRWYYLCNALAEKGVKIDVITIKHPSELAPCLGWQFHEDVNIIRVFPGPIESLALKAKKSIGVDSTKNNKLRGSRGFKIVKSLYWRVRNVIGNVLPGDVRSEWFPFVTRYIKKNIDLSSYDYVITSHEPWVGSLIGLRIKMKEHKNIKWIADFGDPYVAPYTPSHKLWLEGRLERLIYKNADTLIFTNYHVIDHLKGKYPFLKNKDILVLEQGLDYEFCTKRKEDERIKGKIFTLVYTGTLYKDFRNPLNLIKALSMVDFEYKLQVAGRNEQFIKDFQLLGNRFEFMGFLNHFDVLELQKKSDVLIHLSNKNSIQIPGKFYEYLGAIKPILGIYYDRDDTAVELIEKLQCGIPCKNEVMEIKGAIEMLYYKWKNDQEVCGTTFDNLYDYSWKKKAAILHESMRG